MRVPKLSQRSETRRFAAGMEMTREGWLVHGDQWDHERNLTALLPDASRPDEGRSSNAKSMARTDRRSHQGLRAARASAFDSEARDIRRGQGSAALMPVPFPRSAELHPRS
jgi:hypothetical protein